MSRGRELKEQLEKWEKKNKDLERELRESNEHKQEVLRLQNQLKELENEKLSASTPQRREFEEFLQEKEENEIKLYQEIEKKNQEIFQVKR